MSCGLEVADLNTFSTLIYHPTASDSTMARLLRQCRTFPTVTIGRQGRHYQPLPPPPKNKKGRKYDAEYTSNVLPRLVTIFEDSA